MCRIGSHEVEINFASPNKFPDSVVNMSLVFLKISAFPDQLMSVVSRDFIYNLS